MTDLKMNTYYRPGITTLDKMQRERESFAAAIRRRAEHDAQILKDMDAEIAALREKQANAQNESVAS